MKGVFALPSMRLSLLASTLIGLGLATVPLLGIHGVESALVLGATLPLLTAPLGARIAVAARREGAGRARTLAERSIGAALTVLALPAIVLALNALRVKNCAPLEGLAFMALGPGAGVVLAALIGACTGALPLRPGPATALALLIPLGDIARALYDLYATPAVFAYGHFFGYFPGSLYDELIEIPPRLLSLRALTLVLVLTLLCLLGAHFDRVARALRLRPQAGRRGLQLCLWLGVLVSGAGAAHAEQLGHRGSVEVIETQLGGKAWSKRCELIVPRELRRSRRDRLAKDCDFRIRQLERWFGVRQAGRVRVYLFRSAGEKRELMGAAGTNIAKPWRREIYLQDDVWPHPVLAHELAHVVAGNVGRGPMRVTGKLGGLLPDFALLEGVAVAAAWANSSPQGLTPHQWTKAMLELGLLPRLDALFGTGFLGQQKRVAYTVTGSLLRYVHETRGAAALRRIYQTGNLQAALGVSLATLEREFRAYLATVELPDSARALAKLRFEGSSIFSSVCPHEKARLRQALDGYLAADDTAEAERTCRELLSIDATENAARATLAAVLARRGRAPQAEQVLGQLTKPPSAPPPLIAGTRQLLADEAWRRGRREQARAVYEQLLTQPTDRDTQRMLQVKASALRGSAREQALLFGLLVGEPGLAVDGAHAVHLVRELRSERSDGLPQYLEARQLYSRERFAEAAALLADARRLGLPSPEIALEALRVEAAARFGAGDLATARTLWRELRAQRPGPGFVAEADDWLARIRASTP